MLRRFGGTNCGPAAILVMLKDGTQTMDETAPACGLCFAAVDMTWVMVVEQ